MDLSSPTNTPIPFAAFGPLLRLDFDGVLETPITGAYIDSSVYVNGQSFDVQGVPVVTPPAR
jgi:hypothetical protein